MQHGTEHVGNTGARAAHRRRSIIGCAALTENLAESRRRRERYEAAASLRDEIKHNTSPEREASSEILNILATAGEWLRGEGPHHQIVISSRVRLARNLRDRAFPGWAKKAERTAILEMIKPRVEELPEMQEAFQECCKMCRPWKDRCWSSVI